MSESRKGKSGFSSWNNGNINSNLASIIKNFSIPGRVKLLELGTQRFGKVRSHLKLYKLYKQI